MSARDDLIEIVTRDPKSSGGDETWATDLVDVLVAEVRRADALRLLNERTHHASRAIFCEGLTHAANRLTQWADQPTEEEGR